MILKKEFFNRSSVIVAKDLIGKLLCRRLHDGKIEKWKIVETEGYEGFNDKASHASRGKTPRNSPMFEEAGTIYVYFTYGMHYMLNIVCGPKDHPSAVLVRGVSTSPQNFQKPHPSRYARTLPLAGEGKQERKLNLIGPARLTKFLQIDKSLNNKKLGKESGLWIESPKDITKLKIIKTPRIGVDYSGEIWSKKLYRFVLTDFETKKFKNLTL